ncbi:hypothetical protein C8R45DRAFT_1109846 [Mycena sanguinolenta]|nr:hypothetical protein C8R45DRAFT_1109846 [Mycena sanguinolenta]
MPGSSHQHISSVNELMGPENAPVPAFVHRVSEDRRRVYVEELAVEPPSPIKRMRLQAQEQAAPADPLPAFPTFDLDDFTVDGERYRLFDEEDLLHVPSQPQKARTEKPVKPFKPSDPSLSQCRAKRDAYITALLRRDGTGEDGLSAAPLCPCCDATAPEFRCRDFFGDVMYCCACILEKHKENPLHRVEKWYGGYFVRTSLASLGLRVQLGNRPHQRCSAPEPARTGFIALHINGLHEVVVDFCSCERAADAGLPEIQLLRAGWFPATHKRLQTCATVAILEKFHQDTLQSKMTMYDFYGVLEKLTNNTGIKPPDRYHKGRATAYSVSGVEGTQQGEVLYTIYIALDACFRLKRQLVSSELKDPDLGSGWAYMVETEPYREYLRNITPQKEMDTCSGLAALDYANTKFSRGYSTTGVGMGVCARHEFVLANGVGDLQKREHFSNMDYVLASILKHIHALLFKFFTYDIACIWKIALHERLKKLPPNIRLTLALTLIRFAIPKMHINAHKLRCQLFPGRC